jgi:hypothetical protein
MVLLEGTVIFGVLQHRQKFLLVSRYVSEASTWYIQGAIFYPLFFLFGFVVFFN